MDQFHLPIMGFLLIPLFFLITKIEAQNPNDEPVVAQQDASNANFQPSISIVIGILSLMFSITFVLLVYAKFFHRSREDPENPSALFARSVSARFSGIDKAVIESLPFFRFSSLGGLRQGLECAVCLSRFEDVEILRMLPMCKHAFHIDCIDHWLEKHSSCPLCRRKVSVEDPALFTSSSSTRVANSGAGEGSSFDVFIEREESSRLGGFGSSFRRIFRGKTNVNNIGRNEVGEREGEIREEEELEFHRFNHRIVISDAIINPRWSNLTASDVIFLIKEMTMTTNSSIGVQFSNKKSKGAETRIEQADENSITAKAVSPTERRAVSEITAVARFAGEARDEKVRRLWLPIAIRTVEWFANREREAQDEQVTD